MNNTNGLLLKTSQSRNQEPLRVLAGLLNGLRYGTIEIMVYDGRIVQIESKEKFRLTKQ